MNPLLEHIYKTKRVEDAEGNPVNPFPVAITYDEGATLYGLVKEKGLGDTLEIGMAYGMSTLFICQAHRDNGGGRHTSVDPFQHAQWKSIGLLNIKRAELEDLLRFYDSPSHAILPQLVADGEQFDFIFIDGMHLFDYALLDFFFADKLLRNGGYIMLHDLWMPAIKKVLTFIIQNRNYELLPGFGVKVRKASIRRRLATGMPLRIRGPYCVLRKTAEDDRDGSHYRDF